MYLVNGQEKRVRVNIATQTWRETRRETDASASACGSSPPNFQVPSMKS